MEMFMSTMLSLYAENPTPSDSDIRTKSEEKKPDKRLKQRTSNGKKAGPKASLSLEPSPKPHSLSEQGILFRL